MSLSHLVARYLHRRADQLAARGNFAAAHRNFARAARAGYPPAQYALARAYQIGRGCVQSGAIAKRWYEAAAELGHREAQFELGLILLHARDVSWMGGSATGWLSHRANHERALVQALFPAGIHSESDPEKAFFWLRQSAEAGKPEAQANLGWLYLHGTGCQKSFDDACKWFSSAASHDIGQAALGLSEYFSAADNSNQDLSQSASWAKRASELGNSSGSYRFGVALRDGLGVPSNTLEAEKFFALAESQGHSYAAHDGAVLVLARNPSDEEFQVIIERLRRCAKRNHIPSAMLLAELYSRGSRGGPDFREVAHWYRLAADLGSPQAQFMLGCLYARGEGVALDMKHGVRYFEKAAESGHSQAAFNLGIFFLNGIGVERSVADARRWLSVAAQAGLPQAQLRLGQLLLNEAKTPAETASSRLLIEKASDSGNGEAMFVLSQMLLSEGDSASKMKADVMLRRAVDAGDINACELLLRNQSGDFGLSKVIQALERSAQSGDARAKFVLADVLLTGEKVRQNVPAALELLRDAAEAQEGRAHFLLGVLYCQGNHVAKDTLRGFDHYLQAAQLGHPLAQYNAGVMFLQGIGVGRDVEQAMIWIRRAADSNVAQAIELVASIERDSLIAASSK